MARVDPTLDLHDALTDREPIEKHFVAAFDEEGALGRHDVVLVLQAEINLGVAVAEKINRQEGGMLGDGNQSLPKASNLPEHVLQAVGCLLLGIAPGKQVVDFLQERHMAQGISFTLPQPEQMNPPKHNVAEEDPQRFGQFLVEFDNDGLVKQFFKEQWMARVEGSGRRSEDERFEDTRTTVLPEHSAPPKLRALQLLVRVEEIRILLVLGFIDAKFLEFLVEQVDEDVGHTGAGKM